MFQKCGYQLIWLGSNFQVSQNMDERERESLMVFPDDITELLIEKPNNSTEDREEMSNNKEYRLMMKTKMIITTMIWIVMTMCSVNILKIHKWKNHD